MLSGYVITAHTTDEQMLVILQSTTANSVIVEGPNIKINQIEHLPLNYQFIIVGPGINKNILLCKPKHLSKIILRTNLNDQYKDVFTSDNVAELSIGSDINRATLNAIKYVPVIKLEKDINIKLVKEIIAQKKAGKIYAYNDVDKKIKKCLSPENILPEASPNIAKVNGWMVKCGEAGKAISHYDITPESTEADVLKVFADPKKKHFSINGQDIPGHLMTLIPAYVNVVLLGGKLNKASMGVLPPQIEIAVIMPHTSKEAVLSLPKSVTKASLENNPISHAAILPSHVKWVLFSEGSSEELANHLPRSVRRVSISHHLQPAFIKSLAKHSSIEEYVIGFNPTDEIINSLPNDAVIILQALDGSAIPTHEGIDLANNIDMLIRHSTVSKLDPQKIRMVAALSLGHVTHHIPGGIVKLLLGDTSIDAIHHPNAYFLTDLSNDLEMKRINELAAISNVCLLGSNISKSILNMIQPRTNGAIIYGDISIEMISNLPEQINLVCFCNKPTVEMIKALPRHVPRVKLVHECTDEIAQALLETNVKQLYFGKNISAQSIKNAPAGISIVLNDYATHESIAIIEPGKHKKVYVSKHVSNDVINQLESTGVEFTLFDGVDAPFDPGHSNSKKNNGENMLSSSVLSINNQTTRNDIDMSAEIKEIKTIRFHQAPTDLTIINPLPSVFDTLLIYKNDDLNLLYKLNASFKKIILLTNLDKNTALLVKKFNADELVIGREVKKSTAELLGPVSHIYITRGVTADVVKELVTKAKKTLFAYSDVASNPLSVIKHAIKSNSQCVATLTELSETSPGYIYINGVSLLPSDNKYDITPESTEDEVIKLFTDPGKVGISINGKGIPKNLLALTPKAITAVLLGPDLDKCSMDNLPQHLTEAIITPDSSTEALVNLPLQFHTCMIKQNAYEHAKLIPLHVRHLCCDEYADEQLAMSLSTKNQFRFVMHPEVRICFLRALAQREMIYHYLISYDCTKDQLDNLTLGSTIVLRPVTSFTPDNRESTSIEFVVTKKTIMNLNPSIVHSVASNKILDILNVTPPGIVKMITRNDPLERAFPCLLTGNTNDTEMKRINKLGASDLIYISESNISSSILNQIPNTTHAASILNADSEKILKNLPSQIDTLHFMVTPTKDSLKNINGKYIKSVIFFCDIDDIALFVAIPNNVSVTLKNGMKVGPVNAPSLEIIDTRIPITAMVHDDHQKHDAIKPVNKPKVIIPKVKYKNTPPTSMADHVKTGSLSLDSLDFLNEKNNRRKNKSKNSTMTHNNSTDTVVDISKLTIDNLNATEPPLANNGTTPTQQNNKVTTNNYHHKRPAQAITHSGSQQTQMHATTPPVAPKAKITSREVTPSLSFAAIVNGSSSSTQSVLSALRNVSPPNINPVQVVPPVITVNTAEKEQLEKIQLELQEQKQLIEQQKSQLELEKKIRQELEANLEQKQAESQQISTVEQSPCHPLIAMSNPNEATPVMQVMPAAEHYPDMMLQQPPQPYLQYPQTFQPMMPYQPVYFYAPLPSQPMPYGYPFATVSSNQQVYMTHQGYYASNNTNQFYFHPQNASQMDQPPYQNGYNYFSGY